MQPANSEFADELDLRHYIEVLKRRRFIVVASVIVVVAVAMGLTFRQTPQYRSSTEVLLRSSTSEQLLSNTQDANNSTLIRINVATQIEYMLSRSVQDQVTEELGFRPSISIRANGDTEVVTIRATHPVPETAAEIADTYAQTFIDIQRNQLIEELRKAQDLVQAEIDGLEIELQQLDDSEAFLREVLEFNNNPDLTAGFQRDLDELLATNASQRDFINAQLATARSQFRELEVSRQITQTGGAQLISSAVVPTSPFSPTPIRNGVVAVVIGLIFGVGLAFLFETLDDRVRSKADLERVTGWSVVGMIPLLSSWRDTKKARLISLEEPNSPNAEAYRTLRTSIQFLGLERPLNIIQVTSAQAGDGKSTTLANLGVALARAGNRVILVDCDLRRPRLGDFFGISSDVGLTSVLLGEAELADAVRPVAIERRLAILPSGPPPPNPSELLALHRTAELFKQLSEECDIVLVDAPPLLPVTDAVVLAGAVDGVIVVANATKTKAREVQRASELLAQVNAPVIGTVVNGVEAEGGYGYYYGYGYGYGYGRGDRQQKKSKKDDRFDGAVDDDRTEVVASKRT